MAGEFGKFIDDKRRGRGAGGTTILFRKQTRAAKQHIILFRNKRASKFGEDVV